MAQTRTPATFAQASHVERLDGFTYRINLLSDYCIGAVPNGGYTASCMLAAANKHLAPRGQSDAVTAHFEYPNRTTSGPAVVVIDEVKLGRSLTTLHLTLWQGALLGHAPWVKTSASRRTVLAYTTHTNWDTFTGLSVPTGFEDTPAALLPPKPDFAALKQRGADHTWQLSRWPAKYGTTGSGTKWDIFTPRCGQLSPGVLDMWMRLASGEKMTQGIMPYVVDAFPPDFNSFVVSPRMLALLEPLPPGTVEDESARAARAEAVRAHKQGKAMWYPTVLLDLETKMRLPEEGVEWLAVRVTSRQMRNGKLDIDVSVRDVGGELVALGHQVALMVSWERNVGKKAAL